MIRKLRWQSSDHRSGIFGCVRNTAILFVLAVAGGFQTAHSQTAPSAKQIQAYEGLHKAAHEGDLKALTAAISAGADLESRDSSGRTALHIAAFASHEAVVEALAAAGADMDALENRAYDIVTIAAVANDLDMLGTALKLGASAGNVTSPYDGTALIAAAHLGHFEVVDLLIKNNAPLDHVNNLVWTALIESVVLGNGGPDHIETARLLLAAGADQSIGDGSGVTPLEHAKAMGFKEMVELFQSYAE